jgi:hypothetical protein
MGLQLHANDVSLVGVLLCGSRPSARSANVELWVNTKPATGLAHDAALDLLAYRTDGPQLLDLRRFDQDATRRSTHALPERERSRHVRVPRLHGVLGDSLVGVVDASKYTARHAVDVLAYLAGRELGDANPFLAGRGHQGRRATTRKAHEEGVVDLSFGGGELEPARSEALELPRL